MRFFIPLLGSLPVLFFSVLFCVSDLAAKPPFSVSALEYLLKRKEYDRFDWYMERYQKRYPDTLILTELQGRRYYQEAKENPGTKVLHYTDRTGGIPRKYTDITPHVSAPFTYTLDSCYDDTLFFRAIRAFKKIRYHSPHNRSLYIAMCTMALEANQFETFADEIAVTLNRFGCAPDIIDMVVSFNTKGYNRHNAPLWIALLRTVHRSCPQKGNILALIGKYFYIRGQFDSAAAYTEKALALDSLSPEVLYHARTLAAIQSDFTTAYYHSLKLFDITGDYRELEQAAIFALPLDSMRAVSLMKRIAGQNLQMDQRINYPLFTEESAYPFHSRSYFYTGKLFHLNFPYLYSQFKRDRNRTKYYAGKAAICSAVGMYDSAAWYNLNLVRGLEAHDKQVGPSLFNLAAEYYAAGEYMLSYLRFLDVYRHFKGHTDLAVRYGLGINYSRAGDYTRARHHLQYVKNKSRNGNNKDSHLYTCASMLLEDMRDKKDAQFAGDTLYVQETP